MSKNKKLTKAVRARQARTGEAYTTALMHILRSRKGGGAGGERAKPVASAVARTIELAQDIEAATAADADPDILLSDAGPMVMESYRARVRNGGFADGPRGDLERHLMALDAAVLRKIEVLMYAGRAEESVLFLAADLGVDGHSATAYGVAAKWPVLAGYLRAGLRQARDEGVDLEAAWVTP